MVKSMLTPKEIDLHNINLTAENLVDICSKQNIIYLNSA
jgi:hypothetical protein